jgi:hypothetical protein
MRCGSDSHEWTLAGFELVKDRQVDQDYPREDNGEAPSVRLEISLDAF